jgi:hypothetical protein
VKDAGEKGNGLGDGLDIFGSLREQASMISFCQEGKSSPDTLPRRRHHSCHAIRSGPMDENTSAAVDASHGGDRVHAIELFQDWQEITATA